MANWVILYTILHKWLTIAAVDDNDEESEREWERMKIEHLLSIDVFGNKWRKRMNKKILHLVFTIKLVIVCNQLWLVYIFIFSWNLVWGVRNRPTWPNEMKWEEGTQTLISLKFIRANKWSTLMCVGQTIGNKMSRWYTNSRMSRFQAH